MLLSAIIDTKTRILLYLSSFVAVFFLAIYGKQVCPFIDRLPFSELTNNLLLIYVLHMMLREALYYAPIVRWRAMVLYCRCWRGVWRGCLL
ncbi:MAG: hypothetical protein Q9M09_03900 [Mariprofundaceae bacterium]|nr:hypothetical protein [Mariprofundaceae bacterium]